MRQGRRRKRKRDWIFLLETLNDHRTGSGSGFIARGLFMLAFNLGIFFRNLKDAEVDFAASNGTCHVQFTGRVQALSDQVDLTRHLAVTLRRSSLLCLISFDEQEDDEDEQKKDEEAIVEVRLVELRDGQQLSLVKTQFRFEDISLKPHNPESPDPPPAQAA